jgi:hypothetical protein
MPDELLERLVAPLAEAPALRVDAAPATLAADLERVRAAEGPRLVVVADGDVAALEPLTALEGVDVVLALPDGRPGAVEELRRVLPEPHAVLRRVALRGAALVAEGTEAAVGAVVGPELEPEGVVVAFGPRAARLAAPVAAVEAVDAAAERARRARLEADAALVPALVAELDALRSGAAGP